MQVLSGHQGQQAQALGEALQQGKDAGVMPEEAVRLWGVCAGAEWIWKHGQALFPHARQVLDDSHWAASLHQVAKAPYVDPFQAQAWAEATLSRVSLGTGRQVLGGLRRRQPPSAEALQARDHCWVSLTAQRGRTDSRPWRRGGSPLGSGGMEAANKCICHVRLQRSGAWWYEANSHQLLALRCAKYNGTFDQVFARLRGQTVEG